MFGKTSFLAIAIHIYIITYLIIAAIGAPESVLLLMHVITAMVIIPLVLSFVKSANYAAKDLQDQKEGTF